MNKKGLILSIVAIMSIFLLSFAYYVLVVERSSGRDYNVGEKSVKNLATKEIRAKQINMYYEQALKNAILKSIVEITETGGGKRDLVWNENPGIGIEEKFKAVLEKNFQFYVKDIDVKLSDIYAKEIITYPKNFVFEINRNSVILKTTDELIIGDKDFGKEEGIYPKAKYSLKLNIEKDIGLSLSIFERMYNEFSKSNECVTKSDNFRNIKCTDECIVEKNTLKYEIPLERVGFVVPVMNFKILKQC